MSIGSQGLLDGGSAGENALRCAVALKIIGKVASGVSGAFGESEATMLRQVTEHFRRQAIQAGANDGKSARTVIATIDQQALLGQYDKAQQGQIAMACLSSLQT